MPTLLGHSSHDHDFYILNGSVNTNPAARGFDANYVKTAIECSQPGAGHRIYLRDQNWGGGPRTDVRVQVMHSYALFGNFQGTYGYVMLIKDLVTGKNLVRVYAITNSTNTLGLWYNNSATAVENWVQVGGDWSTPQNTVFTLTVTYFRAGAGAGILQCHMNGALVAGSTTLNLTADGVANFDAVDFGPHNTPGTGGYNAFAEHIVGSYDFPTWGLRDVQGQITAAGTNGSQSTGVYSDVNELVLNTATAMGFGAAGQRFTGVSTDLPAALASSPIMNVRVSANARPGATGPGQLKLVSQQSGGLQSSGAVTPGTVGFGTVAANFPLDQAGNPWTYANYNAAEPGVEAA